MLARDPTIFVDQDRFGGSYAPPGERGNCFQVCLAAILGLPLDQVPHFYNTDEPLEVQQGNVRNWLRQRGWIWFAWEWSWFKAEALAERPPLPYHSLVVVSGKSPRGDWPHAVVGRLTATGNWILVHDPHPSKAGIEGEPEMVEIIAPLPYLAAGEAAG